MFLCCYPPHNESCLSMNTLGMVFNFTIQAVRSMDSDRFKRRVPLFFMIIPVIVGYRDLLKLLSLTPQNLPA